MREFTTVAVRSETLPKMRRIAGETRETQWEMIDRLVTAEWDRVVAAEMARYHEKKGAAGGKENGDG